MREEMHFFINKNTVIFSLNILTKLKGIQYLQIFQEKTCCQQINEIKMNFASKFPYL